MKKYEMYFTCIYVFCMEPYTFLSLTNQSVNLHIARNPMFYLLNIFDLDNGKYHYLACTCTVKGNLYEQ